MAAAIKFHPLRQRASPLLRAASMQSGRASAIWESIRLRELKPGPRTRRITPESMRDVILTANARALASRQAAAIESHSHALPNVPSLNGSGASWKSADVPYNGLSTQATAAAGGAETRPRNVAFHPRIHA